MWLRVTNIAWLTPCQPCISYVCDACVLDTQASHAHGFLDRKSATMSLTFAVQRNMREACSFAELAIISHWEMIASLARASAIQP